MKGHLHRTITAGIRSREARALVQAALDAGWSGRRAKHGVLLVSPDGRDHASCALTTSDHRSYKNLACTLRKAGVDV